MAMSPREEIDLWEKRRQNLKMDLIAHGATVDYAEEESTRLVRRMIEQGKGPGYDIMMRGEISEDGPPFTITLQVTGLPTRSEAERVCQWLRQSVMNNLTAVGGHADPVVGNTPGKGN